MTKTTSKEIEFVTLVYVGRADEANRTGIVSGNQYHFIRDNYGQPVPVDVDVADSAILLDELGDGCVSHGPQPIFLTIEEWKK